MHKANKACHMAWSTWSWQTSYLELLAWSGSWSRLHPRLHHGCNCGIPILYVGMKGAQTRNHGIQSHPTIWVSAQAQAETYGWGLVPCNISPNRNGSPFGGKLSLRQHHQSYHHKWYPTDCCGKSLAGQQYYCWGPLCGGPLLSSNNHLQCI